MVIGFSSSDPYKVLVKIGSELSSNRDLDSLLENILVAAKELSGADGGTFYLIDGESQINCKILFTSSLGISMGGASGNPVTFPSISIDNPGAVSAWCAREQKSVNIADIYDDAMFDFTGSRSFDSSNKYRTLSLLCIPLVNHLSETVAILQLVNAKDPNTGDSIGFSDEIQELCEALSSQAAIAISNSKLISQLEELFEALITLINAAIDDKSNYTGGHCSRVPELTLMLADAAAKSEHEPFDRFNPTTKDIYELRIASLLHDCGKIVTPVHVVDKGTKLETIIDRISLIDERFEILRRDLEIAHIK
ncbi:MAG: GAF domain-containing protein, partial [Caulobacteraceae bacterium]|nr:GAF domain-containing protein [Caulobacteraceae bacterium]